MSKNKADKESNNKTDLTCNKKLVKLFEYNTPQERQTLLTNIDNVLCSMLDLEDNYREFEVSCWKN